MLAVERKIKIIEYIKANNAASVSQLAEKFNVHEATIRRDLTMIEEEGILRRTHGGVILPENIRSESSFSIRVGEQIEEKERIGAKAAETVKDGENIILDSGTTTLQIAKHLVNKSNVTVVTNDINIASKLKEANGIRVIVTGGILYSDGYSLNGMYTNQVLTSLYVQKAFIATPTIHHKFGLSHFDEEIAAAKKGMMERAQEVIVVADHTKHGERSLHVFGDISDVDGLITGKEASELHLQNFVKTGMKVTTA